MTNSSPQTSSSDVLGPRRLAAILAADIAGYTRLMGADEEGTVARVTAQHQGVIAPIIDRHHGRIVKTMGDGFLAVFDSPLDAVRSAVAVQTATAEQDAALPDEQRLRHRIEINVGDVIIAANDIYGDSVNIATRLQQIAEPGGICISGGVHDLVRNRIVRDYRSLGDERLKNIADPVRVYQVLPDVPGLAPRRRVRPAAVLGLAAAIVLVAAAAWWLGVGSHGGVGAGAASTAPPTELADRSASAESQLGSTPEQQREIVFQRMEAALKSARTPNGWMTVERLGIVAGVTEAEAHDILAEHFPRDVMLRKGPAGKLLAHLAQH